MPEREQDPRVGHAHVPVAAHVRLVPVVDDVRRELPRLLPVEPGAEAGESQALTSQRRRPRWPGRRRGSGRRSRRGRTGSSGWSKPGGGSVAVAVPQGADDALVGVVVVERPVVRPHRQVRAPQLGAVGRPDRAASRAGTRRATLGETISRYGASMAVSRSAGRLGAACRPRWLPGRGRVRGDAQGQVASASSTLLERVGDASALGHLVDEPRRPGRDVAATVA